MIGIVFREDHRLAGKRVVRSGFGMIDLGEQIAARIRQLLLYLIELMFELLHARVPRHGARRHVILGPVATGLHR